MRKYLFVFEEMTISYFNMLKDHPINNMEKYDFTIFVHSVTG
jgi:hypothetical protein